MRHDDEKTRRRRSVRAYAMLLSLYPGTFRRRFGPEILEAFERLVVDAGPLGAWKAVLGELVPTLAREHAAAASGGARSLPRAVGCLLHPLRFVLAIAVPALACGWLLRHATRPEDVAAVTLWFAGVAAGIAGTRGRGWASAGAAVAGGVLAASALIAYDAMSGSADILRVAPLLLLLSATAAFTLAGYVRLMVEGLELRPRAAPAAAAAG